MTVSSKSFSGSNNSQIRGLPKSRRIRPRHRTQRRLCIQAITTFPPPAGSKACRFPAVPSEQHSRPLFQAAIQVGYRSALGDDDSSVRSGFAAPPLELLQPPPTAIGCAAALRLREGLLPTSHDGFEAACMAPGHLCSFAKPSMQHLLARVIIRCRGRPRT